MPPEAAVQTAIISTTLSQKREKPEIIRQYLNRMVRKQRMHLPEETRKIQKSQGDFIHWTPFNTVL